jgi:hypothetical protein
MVEILAVDLTAEKEAVMELLWEVHLVMKSATDLAQGGRHRPFESVEERVVLL